MIFKHDLDTPLKIVEALRTLSFAHVFNPYVDRCPIYDLQEAPVIRSRILWDILTDAVTTPIDDMWVGQDLGYGGGRRTGLAFTDDVRFRQHVTRWGVRFERPTHGAEKRERTATVIWDILSRLPQRIFCWNVFPLHPHDSGEPFTNRQHNAKEREAGVEILLSLVKLLKPKRLVGVGRMAGVACTMMEGVEQVTGSFYVRHPSHGGHNIFQKQMREIYGLAEEEIRGLFH